MHRTGHGGMLAAFIHRHATSKRDHDLAEPVSRQTRKKAKKTKDKPTDQGEDGAAEEPGPVAQWPVNGPSDHKRGSGGGAHRAGFGGCAPKRHGE